MRILSGILLVLCIFNASGVAYIAAASMARAWPVTVLAGCMLILAVTLVVLVGREFYKSWTSHATK